MVYNYDDKRREESVSQCTSPSTNHVSMLLICTGIENTNPKFCQVDLQQRAVCYSFNLIPISVVLFSVSLHSGVSVCTSMCVWIVLGFVLHLFCYDACVRLGNLPHLVVPEVRHLFSYRSDVGKFRRYLMAWRRCQMELSTVILHEFVWVVCNRRLRCCFLRIFLELIQVCPL